MKIKKPKIDISKLSVTQIIPKTKSIVNDPILMDIKKPTASFQLEMTPMFNLDEDAIKIELLVSIDLIKGKKLHAKVAVFSYDFYYQYNNLKDLLDEEGEIVSEIFLTCSNLSYSTLRGIIYSNSSKTCIENVLLPIVTGTQLMEGSVKSN